MRFSCCPQGGSQAGAGPPCNFTRAAVLPGSCWAPWCPWSPASSLAGVQGYRQDHHAGHPMESCLLTLSTSDFPSQWGTATSCFPSLDPPLLCTPSQAAWGQPRPLGHYVSHTQTGQSSNSQARRGEVKRRWPHPPSAREMKHESVSDAKGPYLLLK